MCLSFLSTTSITKLCLEFCTRVHIVSLVQDLVFFYFYFFIISFCLFSCLFQSVSYDYFLNQKLLNPILLLIRVWSLLLCLSMLEMSLDTSLMLTESSFMAPSKDGFRCFPILRNVPGCQIRLMVDRSKLPFATGNYIFLAHLISVA